MKRLIFFFSVIVLSIPILSNAQYKLQSAFPNMAALNNPIELVHAEDGTNRLFVLQQNGTVYVFDNSPTVSVRKTFISLNTKVTQSSSEAGLLGIAFHPDYENNRYFFVSYTFDSSGSMSGIWSRISRFRTDSLNADTVRLNSETIFLTQQQPYSNHNGGKIAFGPDGYLYISFGDGGLGGDPQGNGQNRATLLGKILRINIDSASGGKRYSIPVTNPYYGNLSGFKEEIYAYGLRNTWKYSFDPPTNRLWAGDVGQGLFEEVDLIESGKNYGWNKMEGFHCYPDTNSCDTTGKGITRPLWEYPHTMGNSVTGGYVYRGVQMPGLFGKYIYADYGAGTLWAVTYDGINPTTNALVLDTSFSISSFGVDQNRDMYVCRYSSSAGRIYKIVDIGKAALNVKASIEGFYNIAADRLNISDTIRAYLRQNVSPFNVVDSAKTILDSLTFSGVCNFTNAPTGKYYIQLKHRNALEVWSRAGGDSIKKGSVITYDFTSAPSQTYGSNSILLGSKYNIYSGDVNTGGTIDLNDILPVFNDQTNFLTGYIPTDLTGNGAVNLDDLVIVSNNSTKFIVLVRP
ncbi:MAG: PQQ-dependent sugar dehydrogenase [Ignavibacteria bacterium]